MNNTSEENHFYNNGHSFLIEHIARARGCLMGHAVGDAFGGRYEHYDRASITKIMDKDYNSKIRLIPILGEGPHRLNQGQITDDTEMALCLASAICESGGYSADQVAHNYIKWIKSRPIDIADDIKEALSITLHDSETNASNSSISQHISYNALTKNKTSINNGSLMRISPLAIYGITIPEDIFLQLVDTECRITHPNLLVLDICRVFANCIRTAIITGNKEQVLKTAKRTAKSVSVLNIIQDAIEKEEPFCFYPANGKEPECIEADDSRREYAGIALHCALFEVANGHSFERSLERVVSKGGDTDTNASIVGALLGAVYGIGAIPNEWKSSVMEGMQRSGYPFGNFLNEVTDSLIGATRLVSRQDEANKMSTMYENEISINDNNAILNTNA